MDAEREVTESDIETPNEGAALALSGIILASEPLWATAVAVGLLHASVGPSDALGGALIIAALACNQGLLDGVLPNASEDVVEGEEKLVME